MPKEKLFNNKAFMINNLMWKIDSMDSNEFDLTEKEKEYLIERLIDEYSYRISHLPKEQLIDEYNLVML